MPQGTKPKATVKAKPKAKAESKPSAKPSAKKARKKTGGSASSNAVMNAYNHHHGVKCGGAAAPPMDVVGRGAPVNVGLPVLPQHASSDWFSASPAQHAMAAEPMHTMQYIDRGVVFPNVPIYDNPKVFGGGWDSKKGGCTPCGKKSKCTGGGRKKSQPKPQPSGKKRTAAGARARAPRSKKPVKKQ